MKRSGKKTILLVFGMITLLCGFKVGDLPQKVRKEVEKAFHVSDFRVDTVAIPEGLLLRLPSRMTPDNFFKIQNQTTVIGYAYMDRAASKTAFFDYLVIFNAKLEIIHSKVLTYREEYGGEIGSKRWLQQFLGKTGKDRVDYKTNIDGISGATISVRSMTTAIDHLLQSIGILQENKVFK
jgi:hypothetical protein